MNKFKILVITGTVIAVAAIVAMIYVVAFRNPSAVENSNDSDQTVEGVSYVNNEFGYKLVFPESWKEFATDQTELSVMFFLPSENDISYSDRKYGPIMYINAVPMSEVKKQETLCKTPDPNRYWQECAAVENSIGGNKSYKFYWTFADDYMQGHDNEAKAAISNIEFFDVEEPPTMRTFNRSNDGYSFQYPTNVFEAEYASDITLPYNYEKSTYADISLYHKIPIEYCGASGECTPDTIDIKIGAAALDDTLATIKASDMGSQMVNKTFGVNKALVLSQGVEGEGMEYYFLEMPNKKVLMMYYRYINENVVLNYKGVKDFIPYAQQQQIAESIVSSIKFAK